MSLVYHRGQDTSLDEKYLRVASVLQPGSRVLEVGCHTGYFSRHLIGRGHEVKGLELDAEAAKVAAEAGVPVTVGNIEDGAVVSALGGRFDAVLLMDVLEHLVDPEAALRRFKPLLGPGGKLVVTAPNVAYWSVRKDLLLGRWEYRDSGILDRTHLHFYTASTWRKLLESAGYAVTRLEPGDGMIPLEHRLRQIPLLGRLTASLRAWLIAARPELFAITFLIEASPR